MSKTACGISLKWCVRRGGYYFDYEAFGRELFMWDCDKVAYRRGALPRQRNGNLFRRS